MAKEIQRLLRVRKNKSARFKREGVDKKKRVKDSWRRPRGIQGKQRRQKKAKGPHPSPGYGSPLAVRGMHPSGFWEVLVHNCAELEGLDAATQAVRIGGTVGGRKRADIQAKAEEAGLKVLNYKEISLPSAKEPVQAVEDEEETQAENEEDE